MEEEGDQSTILVALLFYPERLPVPFSLCPYRCFPTQYALLSVLAVLVTDIPSALAQPTHLPRYTFNGSAGYIYAEGTWIGDTSSRDPYWRDFALQSSEIRCYKVRRRCLEARAVWKSGVLFSDLLEYDIRKWDQGKVIAVWGGAAATIQLKFDLKKKVVLLMTHMEKPESPNRRKLSVYAHLDDGVKVIDKAKER